MHSMDYISQMSIVAHWLLCFVGKDGNGIICCAYDRKKFNIKAHTIVIGSGNELQENGNFSIPVMHV